MTTTLIPNSWRMPNFVALPSCDMVLERNSGTVYAMRKMKKEDEILTNSDRASYVLPINADFSSLIWILDVEDAWTLDTIENWEFFSNLSWEDYSIVQDVWENTLELEPHLLYERRHDAQKERP